MACNNKKYTIVESDGVYSAAIFNINYIYLYECAGADTLSFLKLIHLEPDL